ncbi:MAG: Eco57I restriction-modification methylase domain-containing protein, partial [Pseudonocardiaceae bacterium]
CQRHSRPLDSVGDAVRAFDLLEANAERARKAVALRLHEAGLELEQAEIVAHTWITTGDFLLHDHATASADYVVGNPPYIRLESVTRPVMDEYRRICPTMRGRADIYVGFFERGLQLLAPSGALAFICADRWMRNQYGSDLRAHVTSGYAVEAVISMHDVDAFEDDVSAYPAVVVIRNGRQGDAIVADANARFGERDARRVSLWTKNSARGLRTDTVEASRVEGWFCGRDLWPTGTPAQLALIADLESRFPPLEDPRTGTRVGIGVATGCDSVYITYDDGLVEKDRLLPLLQADDIVAGVPEWSGRYLVNPWNERGLVELDDYPRLASYLAEHQDRLIERHVARTRPGQWYRTIDRVDPSLLGRPKLVLPDMKAAAHPVLDDGRFYPHHNLYFVVSDAWDLEVLGGLLLSDIANLFVGAYCVKMRGGCYRFQAQYVRRMRVPAPATLTRRDQRALSAAFGARDVAAATAVACRVYGIAALPQVGQRGRR